MEIRITRGTVQDGTKTVRKGETMEADEATLASLRGSYLADFEPVDPDQSTATDTGEETDQGQNLASSSPAPLKPKAKKAKGKK